MITRRMEGICKNWILLYLETKETYWQKCFDDYADKNESVENRAAYCQGHIHACQDLQRQITRWEAVARSGETAAGESEENECSSIKQQS